MKKRLLTQFVILVLAAAPVPVYASSLDDVINQNTVEQTQENQNQTNADNSLGGIFSSNHEQSEDMLEDMNNIVDMSTQTALTMKISGPLAMAASTVVQLLFYVLILGLPVAVLADLGFIVIPFLRTGAGIGGQVNGTNNSMNNGYNNGYNGYNGYNSYRSGYNKGYNNGGMMNQNSITSNAQMDKTKFLFIPVSNEAIMVASSQGSAVEKAKSYVKDSVVKVVVTIAIATLMITGALPKLALFIGTSAGNSLVSAIGNM